jgi:DNA-binding CsgD family transcriptional regulator
VKALNELLDATDTFDRFTTHEGVVAKLKNILRAAGRKFFCLNLLPRPRENFAEAIVASELPGDWLDLYLRNDYAACDPALRHCKRAVLPFGYRVAPYDPQLEPRAAEVVKRAHDFGVCNGTVFPIPGTSGCIGDLWAGGTDSSDKEKDLPTIYVSALYAFYKIQQLTQSEPCAKAILSEREREVLSWVASGKTAWEIGDLLSISQRTVEWHIQQATQKLGARNRMQAIVIAARDRLIDI